MASSASAQMHILSRTDYTDQHLVSVSPLTNPLASSSIRVRPKLLSLIVNTLTCAAHPELKIGWWDVHVLPRSLPSPFNDPEKYGRIGIWGWAEVVDSTLDSIPVGAQIYGFFPLATLPLDLSLKPTDISGIYRETSSYRASAMRMYNTFEVRASPFPKEASQSMALDALAKPTFRLGFLLMQYTFNPLQPIHPFGPSLPWTPEDANLTDSVIVLGAATSKTAISLAYMLQRCDKANRPAHIVALTSEASKDYAQKTGWYTDIVTYGEAERVAQLVTSKDQKVVIVDFGARENATQRVFAAVKDHGANVKFLMVGPEQKADAVKFTPEVVEMAANAGMMLVQAGPILEAAEQMSGDGGEAKLNEEFNSTWENFKQQGGFPGMKIAWGKGLEEYMETYKRMCDGEVNADTSFVFEV